MGHACSVSDLGIKTERGETERNRDGEREKEKEKKKEPWHNFYGTGSPGGGFTSLKKAQQDQPRSNVT